MCLLALKENCTLWLIWNKGNVLDQLWNVPDYRGTILRKFSILTTLGQQPNWFSSQATLNLESWIFELTFLPIIWNLKCTIQCTSVLHGSISLCEGLFICRSMGPWVWGPLHVFSNRGIKATKESNCPCPTYVTNAFVYTNLLLSGPAAQDVI